MTSAASRSASLPVETQWLNPTKSSIAPPNIDPPTPPLCAMKAMSPARKGFMAQTIEVLATSFSPRLTKPLVLGPTKRTPPCRSEEHTSELQSLMRISYAVFCLKKKQITDSQQ